MPESMRARDTSVSASVLVSVSVRALPAALSEAQAKDNDEAFRRAPGTASRRGA